MKISPNIRCDTTDFWLAYAISNEICSNLQNKDKNKCSNTEMTKRNYVFHQACEPEGTDYQGIPVGAPPSISCPDCASAWRGDFKNSGSLGGRDFFEETTFTHCENCGRFGIHQHGHYCTNSAGGNWPTSSSTNYRYRSIIKRFALSDNQVPLEAIRRYLISHYDDVRSITPQKVEELVLSVFRERYGSAEVRYFRGHTYTPDDGIDIVVVNHDTGTIGVQVKRRVSRRTEPVMEIRSFVTSLFSNGIRNGVYVALSSSFSSKGMQLADNQHLKAMGLRLNLVDSDAFFDMLNSVSFRSGEPPWYSLFKDYRGFTDDPYIQALLSQYIALTDG